MIANHFPIQPDQAPRKRFRGQKRYYRRVLQKARMFSLPLEDDHWFDFWHYHADWPGYGNLGWQHRKLHIEALCLVFQNITQQVREYSKPYQTWIYLDLQDAGQDAVYFHTPNPNQDNFPVQLPNVNWDFSDLEEFLAQWLSSLPLRAGVGTWRNNQHFYVYSMAHGHALE